VKGSTAFATGAATASLRQGGSYGSGQTWGLVPHQLAESWWGTEEAGFGVLSCFDHVSPMPSALEAWNAPSLVVAMAAGTKLIAFGVHMLNTALGNPLLLASQLAATKAVSGGRLEVGFRAGSHHWRGSIIRRSGSPGLSHTRVNPRVDDYRMRTRSASLHVAHRRGDADCLRLAARGEHDAHPDDDRTAAQRGVVLVDRRVEGVDVRVQDRCLIRHEQIICEEYRAAATLDVRQDEIDRESRRIACPVLCCGRWPRDHRPAPT
jgi:hypothetical protein